MNVILIYIAVFLLLGFIGFIIFDQFYLKKKRLEQGKITRILLFEQIGKQKVYIANYQGLEETDRSLGIYITIKKLNKAISDIDHDDYFSDNKYRKCLMVCRYAEDDYRVMSRLSGNFLKKTELKPEEYLETETITDEESGEKTLEFKKDKGGNYIQLTDEDNNPLPTYSYEPFIEPIGVSQNAREAQRFNRVFTKRMQEKRGEKQGFWDKYGQILMTGTVVLLLFLAMAYNTNKTTEAQKYMADMFVEQSDKIMEEQKSPHFAESVFNYIQNKDKENPPD